VVKTGPCCGVKVKVNNLQCIVLRERKAVVMGDAILLYMSIPAADNYVVVFLRFFYLTYLIFFRLYYWHCRINASLCHSCGGNLLA
jgi:hypothetical protein